MKRFYLIGAILGTLIPYAYLFQFFMQNGLDLDLFVRQVFANPAASMFAADLLITSVVFWGFLFGEGRRLGMRNLWPYIVLNLLVGLSLALPLFLYFREEALAAQRGAAHQG